MRRRLAQAARSVNGHPSIIRRNVFPAHIDPFKFFYGAHSPTIYPPAPPPPPPNPTDPHTRKNWRRYRWLKFVLRGVVSAAHGPCVANTDRIAQSTYFDRWLRILAQRPFAFNCILRKLANKMRHILSNNGLGDGGPTFGDTDDVE